MSTHLTEDLYALLGIEAWADGEQLRRAWRKLARRWHPDHAGPQATAMFQKLSAAYAVLSDPVARARYDQRRGAEPRQDDHRAGQTTNVRMSSHPRVPSVMLSRVSGPLNSLLSCGIARRTAEGVIDLFLTPQEAAQGGMVTISMRVPIRRAQTVVEELFSAWLAVPPIVAEGAILAPTVLLPGMLQPVRFRIRLQTLGRK